MIKAVVFDFGGVLADEGFREGLMEIGRKNGLNPEDFYVTAAELVYQTGYVTGASGESEFWSAVREKTGIAGEDKELRREILKRFVLRPQMLKKVEELRAAGQITAILSDQTNWLDEIDKQVHFTRSFDYVFNSFKLGKGKRDPSVFRDICSAMGLPPNEVLLIDDNAGNVGRAEGAGLNAVHFSGIESFQGAIRQFFPS